MLVSDVFSYLDELAPFSYSMDFDNSGLLIGDPSQSVKKILVALDCTKSVVSKAREMGADLIVTHHPVIFDPLKNVMVGSVPHDLRWDFDYLCSHQFGFGSRRRKRSACPTAGTQMFGRAVSHLLHRS